jgi:hypothetical protein
MHVYLQAYLPNRTPIPCWLIESGRARPGCLAGGRRRAHRSGTWRRAASPPVFRPDGGTRPPCGVLEARRSVRCLSLSARTFPTGRHEIAASETTLQRSLTPLTQCWRHRAHKCLRKQGMHVPPSWLAPDHNRCSHPWIHGLSVEVFIPRKKRTNSHARRSSSRILQADLGDMIEVGLLLRAAIFRCHGE